MSLGCETVLKINAREFCALASKMAVVPAVVPEAFPAVETGNNTHILYTHTLLHPYTLTHSYTYTHIHFRLPLQLCRSPSLYKDRAHVHCINSLVQLSGADSLGPMLTRLKPTPRQEIHFLSIDVDGADIHIWNGLHDNTSTSSSSSSSSRGGSGSIAGAAVVCIEFNPTIPNSVSYAQEKDIRVQRGSSLRALTELGAFT
jgi:hypothetical protein